MREKQTSPKLGPVMSQLKSSDVQEGSAGLASHIIKERCLYRYLETRAPVCSNMAAGVPALQAQGVSTTVCIFCHVSYLSCTAFLGQQGSAPGSWYSGGNAFLFCLLKYHTATKMSAAPSNLHHYVGWSLHMLLVLSLQEKNILFACSSGSHVLTHVLSNSLQIII